MASKPSAWDYLRPGPRCDCGRVLTECVPCSVKAERRRVTRMAGEMLARDEVSLERFEAAVREGV